MGRRSVRISLFVVALLATAGLGYRAMADERAWALARQDGVATDQVVEETLTALLDVRGSMYAYVAPSQGTQFWGARVSTMLDTLQERLTILDAAVASSGRSLSDSLDGIDQLTAADKRARQYVDRGELLLAGDVLFTEVRDLLNAVTEQVVSVRQALRDKADATTAGLRQEQAMLAAAGVALWSIVALLLVPGHVKPVAQEPGEWRQELADTLKKSASAPEDSAELLRDLAEAPLGREGGPIPEIEPLVIPPPPQTVDLKIVAEICADLSTLTDIGALSGALARAGEVIGAKGLIVWVTSNDGNSLSPVATHGFDARVVARIGAIDRTSANLTAEALRDNAPKISLAVGSAGAALAVPMCGPSGPVGVLSAEMQPGRKADDVCVAVASILAAQLATLTAPLPVPLPVPLPSAVTATESSVESAAS